MQTRLESLRDLYQYELQDLRDAESQMADAFPRLADAARAEPLRTAPQESLEHTRKHRESLDGILEKMNVAPDGVVCQGMRGIVSEISKIMQRDAVDEDVRDAAIIAAAQRFEHYTIASYGTVPSYAEMLGEEEARGPPPGPEPGAPPRPSLGSAHARRSWALLARSSRCAASPDATRA